MNLSTTKIDLTTVAVRRTLGALASANYEIGILTCENARQPVEPPTQPLPNHTGTTGQERMLLRVCDAAGLLHMVPYLKHQNAHGAHIYIRPAGEHNLSLMDDLNERQLHTLKTSGFEPCAIVETSPGNFQAWLKHPSVLPRRLSTLAARELVAKFGGDIGSADWRHFGRLPGFTNRKPKYEKQGKWPFVLLHGSSGLPYAQGELFLHRIEQIYTTQMEDRHKQRFTQLSLPRRERFSFLSIERFRSNPKYGGDLHRADMAFSTAAKALGMPDTLIQAAIESRDLSKKGSRARQQDYLRRTIEKAIEFTGQ